MSKSVKFSMSVNVPSLEEFAERFPQYANKAEGEGSGLFKFIMSPDRFVSASCATKDLALPAVAGVAEACTETFEDLGRGDRQFIGALVCALMEANGFEKTGKKKAIPHKEFSKGEFYRESD